MQDEDRFFELGKLPDDELYNVLLHLDVKSLCEVAKVSRRFCLAAQQEGIWKTKATEFWPEKFLNLDMYDSYRELVLDGNRRSVTHSIALENCSSLWCYNDPDIRYYECKLLKVQYLPARDTLRLYFDARGEVDLRGAEASSLALVLPVESGACLEPKHVLAWFFPTSFEKYCDTFGHQKGYLDFELVEQHMNASLRNLNLCAQGYLDFELVEQHMNASFPPQLSLQHHTVQLAFVYAHCSYNTIDPHYVKFMWTRACRDYTPAFFLPIPTEMLMAPNFSLHRLFNGYQGRALELVHEPGEELQGESEEVEQERWAGVPRVTHPGRLDVPLFIHL